jgi:DNA-binding response OmpR family regulator
MGVPGVQGEGLRNIADLKLDSGRRVLSHAGKMITLSKRDCLVIEYLLRNAGGARRHLAAG